MLSLAEHKKWKIMLDMDGVLVDFRSYAEKVLGKDFQNHLADASGWDKLKDYDPNFWEKLDWLPEGKKVWRRVKHLNLELLTAYPKYMPSGKAGKIIWAKKNLRIPAANINAVLRIDKKKFANPHVILIDDYKKNIDEFNAAGGIGIHYKGYAHLDKELKKLNL